MEKGDICKNEEEMEEERNIINKYNCFLKQTLKKFNVLFLCHSKEEYVKMMKRKGCEMERDKEKGTKEKKEYCINEKRKIVNKGKMIEKNHNVKKEREFKEEEFDFEDNYKEDNEIFSKFLNEMKKKKEDFLHKK